MSTEWEVTHIKAEIERTRQILDGNGRQIGLVTKVNGLEGRVNVLIKWMDAWKDTTNIKEFESMREIVKDLSHRNSVIMGAFTIINLLIIIFGPLFVAWIKGHS